MENSKKQQNYARSLNSSSSFDSSRKSSDQQVNKNRNARRRDQNSSPRNEQQQQQHNRYSKQQQQKTGRQHNNNDKRPRPRGGGGNGNGNYKGDKVDATDDNVASTSNDLSAGSSGLARSVGKAKLNSIYMPGSKKQSLNYLLNFQSYHQEHGTPFGHNGNGGRSHYHMNAGHGGNRKSYSKEQFIQANFQFVIRANAQPQMTASPDSLMDWHLIEQINIQTTEEPQCPICLYPPVAAKLTRCGHVYCWPCILHYISLGNKPGLKCPICSVSIHAADLKSCTILQQCSLNLADRISFQLMRRRKDSIYIERYNANRMFVERFPFMCKDYNIKCFSKFLIANKFDLLDIIEREQRELNAIEDVTPQDFKYVQDALDLLKVQREKLITEEFKDEECVRIEELETLSDTEQTPNETGNSSIELRADNDVNVAAAIDFKEQNESQPANENKFYYFYQSNDGQNIYLHPLNVKMLQACYGSLDKAPLVIEANIVQMEHHSMDEDLRRKFTCLKHLPLTRQFAVVEVNLQPPIITTDILKLFEDDLVRRKYERQCRERDERKWEKHINELNDRQMGKLVSRSANLNLQSNYEFPTFGYDDSHYMSSSLDSVDMPPLPKSAAANATATIVNQAKTPPVSYSSITINNPATTDIWSALPKPNARESGASSSRNCDSPVNEWTPTSLSDVLAVALSQNKQQQQQHKIDGNGNANANGNGNASGKKQKKNKKMTPIFATGMNYGGN